MSYIKTDYPAFEDSYLGWGPSSVEKAYGEGEYQSRYAPRFQQLMISLPSAQKTEQTQQKKIELVQTQSQKPVLIEVQVASKGKTAALTFLVVSVKPPKGAEKVLENVHVLILPKDYRDEAGMYTYYHKNNGGLGAYAKNGVLMLGLEPMSRV